MCIFTVTGGNSTDYYRFLKGFYGLADIPTIFQERIDTTLEHKHPAWLDDIIIVTKGNLEKHEMEVRETMTKLEKAGYRLNPNKCEFFKKEIEWVGHKIDQQGIRPLQDKLDAIKKINIPKNEKELKSFLGAIQYLSKYIENLSTNTDILRRLLKKQNEWIWTEEHTKAFNNLKECITKIPCLAHYNAQSENIITTDASTKGLGATLWQKQKSGELEPIGFASRYLSDTEKKYAINELELLAVVWGLEHFRLYIYGKPIELLTNHQALEPLIKRNRSNKTYSARLTRWLDRLAHFDINIKHISGKHLALTDYLSRNPISNPEPIENYDEEYVINCITPLLEFINNYGSITGKMNKEPRTDEIEKCERKLNQSESSKRNEPKSDWNKTNKRSSLLPQLNTVDRNTINNVKHNHETIMDIRRIEQIEADDPSEETQQLVNRWKELVQPGEYRTSKGNWKKYNPPRHHRAEIKRIEMNLNQRRNKMLWKRMEEQEKKPEDDTTKREELYRVIEKIRNLPKKQDEGQTETTNDNITEAEANQKQTKQNQPAPQTHLMYQQLVSKDISVRPE